MTSTNQPSDSNEIEFHETVGRPASGSGAIRLGIVAGSAILFVIGAVAVMAASPSPSTSTGAAPAATSAPGASTVPGTTQDNDNDGPGRGNGEFGGFAFGRSGFRDITIIGISGSDISLKTADGWTRTIAVTSSTAITKAGATIAIGDLAVGDQIRFAQARAAAGTYDVTAIAVVLPNVGGQVTAVNGDTITVTQRDGTTATIHVDANTTYKVNGADGKLTDVKVGSFVAAEGTLRSDGSLDAASVRNGLGGRGGFKGGHDGPQNPAASPASSSGAS